MSSQTYIQNCLCGLQGKQVKKHFVAEYAIQNHYNLGILRTHGKISSHIKKIEANKSQSALSKSFKASASNKVLHQETFTTPSYQLKKAEILLAVHSNLTYTIQRTMEKYVKLTKVLLAESKILEQLELQRTKFGYLLQFGLAPYFKEQIFS